VNDPFLVDECLSLNLVALAHARGHQATHVGFRDRQGTDDPDLMRLIGDEGFVFVTNNAADFLALYAAQEIHAGLVVIVPGGVIADVQVRLFGLALDVIEPMPDLMNKVVEVFIDGTVQLRELPEQGARRRK